MLFGVKHPRKEYTLSLQLYDRDFFKSNDIIGDATLDLKHAILDCALTQRPLGLSKKYYNDYLQGKGYDWTYKDDNSFWVPVRGKDKDGKMVEGGKVRIQVDIYPKAMAVQNKVGEARQEPNHSPFLPPPIGRISFTMNPLKMFQQMVGPALRRKIYCYCCLAVCMVLLIMLAPSILGNFMSLMLAKLFGLA